MLGMKDQNEFLKYFKTFIIDKNGISFWDEISYQQPFINNITDNIIEYKIGYGAGVYYCYYFDLNKKAASEIFESPIAVNGDNIAFLEYDDAAGWIIIIQNIWDKNVYHQTERIDLQASSVFDAKFMDGNKLWVSYVSNDEKEVEKIIDLDITADK